MKDTLLPEVLKLLNNLHQQEMVGHKLQCVTRGTLEAGVSEYHITWTSQGIQYRSYVKSFSSSLQETSFGEL
jgi:hypothetical protein